MRLPPILTRLVLPCAMAALLLLALAYWWLDNLLHEIFGTALFLLLVWHIAVNRFWFKTLFRGQYDLRRAVTLASTLLLITNMTVLLGTSVAISKSLFAALPVADSMPARELHWFSAYWVMIIVGIHLGLHWGRVMSMVSKVLRLSPPNPARTWLLRLMAALLAIFGLSSWVVLDVGNKLTFTYSMVFWDFTAAVSPFFGHWTGVMGLPAIATYYSMALLRAVRNPRIPASTAQGQIPSAPKTMPQRQGRSF